MSGQQLQLNSVPNNPELIDLLNLLKKEIFLDLSCHHVGTIQSFNATAMTVVATVNYTKTFFQLNPTTNLYAPVQVNYPVIIDCPIVVLGGGKTNLTFPITKGDECLLLFNDRDIDNWYKSGQIGPVASMRYHSISDAFALIGVKSTPNLLTAYDTVRAILTNGNVKVGINPSNNKATIQNNTTTLNTLLQSLVTNIQNLVTATAAITVSGVTPGSGASAVPVNAAAITAVGTALTTLGTQIGGLLE